MALQAGKRAEARCWEALAHASLWLGHKLMAGTVYLGLTSEAVELHVCDPLMSFIWASLTPNPLRHDPGRVFHSLESKSSCVS